MPSGGETGVTTQLADMSMHKKLHSAMTVFCWQPGAGTLYPNGPAVIFP